ncbi:Bug family tripartite tricarboxylate transporter substrate binding protein [Halomonas sp. IOP_31]|uniref:Bug family tripartite tricarboxylate transporter substrate binding protein n=1 Tax=Halomonas sp. IOP_31 TaxID=2876584 RepID=UPI001E48EB2B|nr:tripartite tricarboxylate transporter substrate binding protein [Halomonas sp. IOP_31]MCD6009582.1 tripartite tricarboxylate transporter substrate binding protein [Halomonas sp. IOP_31]
MTFKRTTASTLNGHLFRAGLMTAALVVPLSAAAQEDSCDPEQWPTQTIELVSHSSAGGGTDMTMRMWMDAAAQQVDEDVVIVYKLGGGARAAQEYFQEQGADCHTIMAFTQTHLYTIARGNSPIEISDMQGVARAMDDPSVIVVRSDSPYESYEELVKASKDQALTWGVAQVGGTEHIGIERWAEAAGTDVRVVPFGGGGDMVTALRSGAVDASLANVSEALGQIQEGDLRALAALSDERIKALPNVPTAAELGDDVQVSTTRGYYVDADTPPEMVDRIEKWILNAMESTRYQEYVKSAGLDPADSIAGSEVWDKQIKEEYQTALEAMRKLGLTEK